MKVSVLREALYPALTAAARATSQRGIQPVLSNILLETAEDALVLSATDLDFGLRLSLPATIHTPGRITLPAKKTLDIISKLPAESTVELWLDVETQLMHIACNDNHFDVRTMSADEFPALSASAETQNGQLLNLPVASFLRGIQHTAFAAAPLEGNSILGGIYLQISGNQLEMAATDGSRLARYQEPLENPLLEGDQVLSAIMPAKMLQEIARLSSSFSADEPLLKIVLSPGQVMFQSGRFTAYSRLLEGQYPRYSQLIPAENNIVIEANKKLFIEALDRTAVMANERTHLIKMQLESGMMALMANSPELGDSRGQFEVLYTGDPMSMAFNYKYVLDALKVIESTDVRMETNGALAPTIFRAKPTAETPAEALCLVMPIQVR